MFRLANATLLSLILSSSYVVVAAEPATCAVFTSDDVRHRLEGVERQLLLTEYVEAAEAIRQLQRDFTCLPEAASPDLLARMYLDFGVALHRLGLVSDGDLAFATAAAISPGILWNESFAASLGMQFYRVSRQVSESPNINVQVSAAEPGVNWYLDGRLQGTQPAVVPPGQHLVQVSRQGAWSGEWYNLQGTATLDLAPLTGKMAGGSSVSPSNPSPVNDEPSQGAFQSTNTYQRTGQARWKVGGGVAVGLGAGMFLGSIAASQQADEVYSGLTAATIDAYDDRYVPLVQLTNGLRVAGTVALVGGMAAAGMGFMMPAPGGSDVALLVGPSEFSLRWIF